MEQKPQSPKPKSSMKVLRAALPAAADLDQEEADKHAQSQAEFDERMAEAREKDKVGEVLEHAPYATNHTPAQVWGDRLEDEDRPSRFHFSRWYFGIKGFVLVDLFPTQKDYDAGRVEERRKLCHKYGARYAALGPKHSRYPLPDQKLRKLYPSMVEQLDMKSEG